MFEIAVFSTDCISLLTILSSDDIFDLFWSSDVNRLLIGKVPDAGTFPMNQWFASDDPNTGASASVLPVNI